MDPLNQTTSGQTPGQNLTAIGQKENTQQPNQVTGQNQTTQTTYGCYSERPTNPTQSVNNGNYQNYPNFQNQQYYTPQTGMQSVPPVTPQPTYQQQSVPQSVSQQQMTYQQPQQYQQPMQQPAQQTVLINGVPVDASMLPVEHTIGNVIREHKKSVPFPGMNPNQKISIKDVVCREGQEPNEHKILVLAMKIAPSKVNNKKVKSVKEVDENGVECEVEKVEQPDALIIRFKKIISTNIEYNPETGLFDYKYIFEKQRASNGMEMPFDAEYFTYTNSEVLIDQFKKDLDESVFPIVTTIREYMKSGSKSPFYKFE